MAIIELNKNPSTHELKRFGMIGLPVASVLFAAVLYWRAGSSLGAGLALAVGLMALAVGWWQPGLLRTVYVASMFVSYPLAWLLSHVLMVAMFFLVFVLVGMVLRLMGRDPLDHKFDREAASYWKPRGEQSTDPGRYFRQY